MNISPRLSVFLVILLSFHQAVISADHDHTKAQEQVLAIIKKFSKVVENGALKDLSALINKYPLLIGTPEEIQKIHQGFEKEVEEGNDERAKLIAKTYAFIRKPQEKNAACRRLSLDMSNKNKIEKSTAHPQNPSLGAPWGSKEIWNTDDIKAKARHMGYVLLADALSSIEAWYERDEAAIKEQTRCERDKLRHARLVSHFKD